MSTPTFNAALAGAFAVGRRFGASGCAVQAGLAGVGMAGVGVDQPRRLALDTIG
jgi:hypothetical protein